MTSELQRIYDEMMAHIDAGTRYGGICYLSPAQIAGWSKVIKEELK